jgi:hypothetical protein
MPFAGKLLSCFAECSFRQRYNKVGGISNSLARTTRSIPLERIEYAAEDFFDYMTFTEGIQDNTSMKYLKNTKQLLKLAVNVF